MKPPMRIDGADVVYWAWSEPEPFFRMPCVPAGDSIPIHGLAICRYRDSGAVYRFSCNRDWEAENDAHFGDSLNQAMCAPSAQYEVSSVEWIKQDGLDGAAV